MADQQPGFQNVPFGEKNIDSSPPIDAPFSSVPGEDPFTPPSSIPQEIPQPTTQMSPGPTVPETQQPTNLIPAPVIPEGVAAPTTTGPLPVTDLPPAAAIPENVAPGSVTAPATTNQTQAALPGHTVMPSEIDAYKPLETQQQVAQISPAKFDNLTKVLDILRQNRPEAISIKGSYIHEVVAGSVIVADVRSIFDGAIDFQITDPKKHVDLFKQFKGNNNIFILDDPENTRYILTNGPIKIFLPKQIDQLVAEASAPDISNSQTLSQKIITKDTRDEIRGLGRHSNSIEFLLQGNAIKAMHIPDTGIYRFEEYIKDPEVAKLDETNADLVLKSELFLPVDSDSYKITIVKKPTGEFLSVTECNTGLVKMWIFEQLEETTGGNLNF